MGSISILLADDSVTIQKVVGIIFGSEAYSLTIVDNGTAAVEKAKAIKPDVLLIDALMPGMTGYEVCETLRKEPELATKPVLLLTGSFEPFDEEKARSCGADDHIVKPFESQQLIAKVTELVELGRNRAVVQPEPAAAAAAEPGQASADPFGSTRQSTVPPLMVDASEAGPQEYTFAFAAESDQAEAEVAPVAAQDSGRAVDDPWGAFTTTTPGTSALGVDASEETQAVPDAFERTPFDGSDTVMMEESPIQDAALQDHTIGASWVPVEEQTFEFREEGAVEPVADAVAPVTAPSSVNEPVFGVAPFDSVAAEPITEQIADVPPLSGMPEVAVAEPVAEGPAGVVALTDEQLIQAIRAASKDTIERIVWEVVPDLAETMIKEAIKRITDGK